jgi:hypothetical protein
MLNGTLAFVFEYTVRFPTAIANKPVCTRDHFIKNQLKSLLPDERDYIRLRVFAVRTMATYLCNNYTAFKNLKGMIALVANIFVFLCSLYT